MEQSRVAKLVDRAVATAQREHSVRVDGCEDIPLKRRGRRLKKRPNASVLNRLAAGEIGARRAKEPAVRKVPVAGWGYRHPKQDAEVCA